jgi:uncharacterized ferredoxin-like protein
METNMGIVFEEAVREEMVTDVAKRMMLAARTAPKARGIDNLVLAVVDKEGIAEIAAETARLVKEEGAADFFLRDSENILNAESMVLIGTKIAACGVPFCGLCGFGDCAGKSRHPESPCAFNTGDLGIAVGSAVSIAADARVDNRVMFSAGVAAKRLGFLGPEAKIIYAIPLSARKKNPFFDRVWPKK